MKLTSEEQAMLDGERGPARKWALEHQMQVGRMFDAVDMAFRAKGEAVGVVVFAAPHLSLVEMQTVADLCRGRKKHGDTAFLVCTAASVYSDAERMGSNQAIEDFGGRVLQGTCFYQQYAREIGEANGWKRLLSNSTKIVNILGGYGYAPALASMKDSIDSAVAGSIV